MYFVTRSGLRSLSGCLILLLVSMPASAVLTNWTFDDHLGDTHTGFQVQYLPATVDGGPYWKNESGCVDCAIKPGTELAFDHTWTGTTYFQTLGQAASATFNFTGIALYVYFILTNDPLSTSFVSNAHCDFLLDGDVVGNFNHTTDGSYAFQYNALVYHNTSLSNDFHTFSMSTEGSSSSYVIFDYAQYTVDVPDPPSSSGTSGSSGTSSSNLISATSSSSTSRGSPSAPALNSGSSSGSGSTSATSSSSSHSSSSSSTPLSSTTTEPKSKSHNTAAVVGGVIAGLAALAIVAAVFIFCRRRKQHDHLVHQFDAFRPNVEGGSEFSLSGAQSLPTTIDRKLGSRKQEMRMLDVQRAHPPMLAPFSHSRTQTRTDVTSTAEIGEQMEQMRALIHRWEEIQHQSRSGAPPSSALEPLVHTDAGRVELPPAYVNVNNDRREQEVR